MAGHSRSKNGVLLMNTYVPAIHVLRMSKQQTWMPGTRPGMTVQGG